MKTVETHTMPAQWASALINGDTSGLSRDFADVFQFNFFFEKNPEFKSPVSCSENPTVERFTFSPGFTLLTECLEYSFLRGE